MIDWRALVLDEGELGTTRGRLLAVGGHFQILTADGEVSRSRGVPFAVSGGVRLATSQPGQQRVLRRLVDEWVDVVGKVGDNVLRVTAVTPLRESDARDLQPEAQPMQRRSFLPRSEAERLLFETGALLAMWEEPRRHVGSRTIALASDPERVRARLSGLYGDKLEVVASTRTVAEIEQLTDALDERLVVTVGYVPGPDLQCRVRAKVWHLPSSLARRLEPHASAYDLDALVRPAVSH